jgi:hypothetical protein
MEGDPLVEGGPAVTGSPHSGQVERPEAMRSRQIGHRAGDETSPLGVDFRPTPAELGEPAAAPR